MGFEASSPFVDKVPDYEIRDNVMHILVAGECLCCMPVRVFRAGLAKSADVLARYDHGTVVDFPKPKRRAKPDG